MGHPRTGSQRTQRCPTCHRGVVVVGCGVGGVDGGVVVVVLLMTVRLDRIPASKLLQPSSEHGRNEHRDFILVMVSPVGRA